MKVLDVKETGMNIYVLMIRKKMTVNELSIKTGLTPAAVYKWLNGDGAPSLDTLVIPSSIFDVTIDDIVARRKINE